MTNRSEFHEILADLREGMAARARLLDELEWFKTGDYAGFKGVVGDKPRLIFATVNGPDGIAELLTTARKMERGEL